jgi:hypothetical protein
MQVPRMRSTRSRATHSRPTTSNHDSSESTASLSDVEQGSQPQPAHHGSSGPTEGGRPIREASKGVSALLHQIALSHIAEQTEDEASQSEDEDHLDDEDNVEDEDSVQGVGGGSHQGVPKAPVADQLQDERFEWNDGRHNWGIDKEVIPEVSRGNGKPASQTKPKAKGGQKKGKRAKPEEVASESDDEDGV